MSIELIHTEISGCNELQPKVVKDVRGTFIKTFCKDLFEEKGLRTDWVEQYYTVSRYNVLRGLHYQVPPHDHAKLVYCVLGEVLDVAVDLREGSPTYGKFTCVTLSSRKCNMLYLERGLAHGFYTKSELAILMYNVTSLYAPEYDMGIRWDSAAIPWPNESPILSDRDREFPTLLEVDSVFKFSEIE